MLEPLGHEAQACSIPPDELDPVGTLSAEHVDHAGVRLAAILGRHQRRERARSLPEIHGPRLPPSHWRRAPGRSSRPSKSSNDGGDRIGISAVANPDQRAGYLQLNRVGPRASALRCRLALESRRRWLLLLEDRRHEHRCRARCDWQRDTALLHLLAQHAAPSEELGYRHAMAARHRAHTLRARIALRDDRGRHLRRLVPTLADTGENLEAPHTANTSIIT